MPDIQQVKGEGSHTAGEGRFTYTITSRAEHVGGGWQLKLLDNGEEVGGGVFPLTDETTHGDAYGDAWLEGEGWLGSRPGLDDVMIDTETAGTTPGSAILSIGAVMFGPAGLGASFYAPILLQSCTHVGLIIDPKTITWWMNQSDQARAAAFHPDAAPLPQMLLDFSNWFVAQRAKRPWCQGANFDIPLLDAAYKACGMVPPWQFWNVRDTRTLFELAGVKVDRSKGTYHNALDDAHAQAEAAVKAMRVLNATLDSRLKADNECLLDEVEQLRQVIAGFSKARIADDHAGDERPIWTRQDFAEHIVLAVAEQPDLTSPDEYPDYMLVKPNKLRDFIENAFEAADEDGGLEGCVATQPPTAAVVAASDKQVQPVLPPWPEPVSASEHEKTTIAPWLTDKQIVDALHSLGIDTEMSKYGFPEIQVRGTNVPNIRRLVAKLAALAPQPLAVDERARFEAAWQPISTAPKDAYIIGYWEGYKRPCVMWWNVVDQAWESHMDSHEQPSRWLPLPPHPTAKGAAGQSASNPLQPVAMDEQAIRAALDRAAADDGVQHG
ncbi:3'-5' exonuclease [Massilia aerilata]|uniref:3'-5' exonuclease n=1 Tax=Massilia aerilata TaxID=453817 RepID=A0ABW0S7C9_9BURK